MTSISILGSGNMARGIGTRALAGGNDVQILDREPAKAGALAEELGANAGTLGDPLTGELVVLALPYDAAAPVVRQYGDALADKVIVDITNPVDFTTFAGLATPDDSSGAQEIAKVAPSGAQVVKAFNTTFAGTLVAGEVDGHSLDVFVAGDDADAKATVSSFIESAGLRPIDVGDLSRARYLEGLGFLHMGLQMTRGTNFATGIKLVGG
ncbi:MAG: NADPH-dependent F420 reductase [Acidimicrobiales bacterium]